MLNRLSLKLEKRDGVKPTYIWLRSPKILSKPLMFYCRLIKLTNYKWIDGIRYGQHEFYKSRFVSYVFPLLQLIDFSISYFFNKKKISQNKTVLFDRFSIDTLADLMVDTHRFDLHKTFVGSLFLKFVPQNTRVIVLSVDENTIRSRKKDTLHDPSLESKIKVYSVLSEDLNFMKVSNIKEPEKVFEEILLIFKL